MKLRNIFILIALFSSVSLFSQTNKTIIINDSWEPLNLNEYTCIYSTSDTSADVNLVKNKKFIYTPTGLNVGVNDKIRWERFILNNPTNKTKEYYIYFPYNHINKIIAYTFFNDTLQKTSRTGTYYNYNNKDIDSRGYPILVKLKPGNTQVYIYVNHLQLPLKGASYLLTEAQVRETNYKSEKAIWFWKGVFLFAMLITLALFITTKLKLFLYYFLLNLGVGIFFASEIGDFFIFFDTDTLNNIIDIKHFGNIIILFAFPLFINEITPIKNLLPKTWKVMFYGIFIIPILWLICLIPGVKETHFLYFTTQYFIFGSGIVFILQLYYAFVAYKHKSRNSLAVLIAYSFYVSAVFINVILPNLGLVENSIEAYNSFISGSIFEIVIFMGLIGKETLSIYNDRSKLLEKQKNHQTEIIRAIVESQEKERNKVGRELHDMIGANISVIKQQVDKNNTSLINIIKRTIDSVRNLSHGLVTPLIKDDEFVDEINELCSLSSNMDIKMQSYFHNWTKINNPEKATHLYRIVQELLQNAIKHSKAKSVLIQFIVNKEDELTIMYEDDGIGFDYKKAYNNKGLGLMNIENRIQLIDASIIYDTQQGGKGTTIIINLSSI